MGLILNFCIIQEDVLQYVGNCNMLNLIKNVFYFGLLMNRSYFKRIGKIIYFYKLFL